MWILLGTSSMRGIDLPKNIAITRPTYPECGVYVQPQDFAPQLWLPRTMEWIDALHSEVERNPRDMEMAYTADDIVRIHRERRIAALLSLEGGHLISDSLALLRDYYRSEEHTSE